MALWRVLDRAAKRRGQAHAYNRTNRRAAREREGAAGSREEAESEKSVSSMRFAADDAFKRSAENPAFCAMTARRLKSLRAVMIVEQIEDSSVRLCLYESAFYLFQTALRRPAAASEISAAV